MNEKIFSEIDKELQEKREWVANALNTVKMEYIKKNYGDSLKILGPLLDSLSTVTAAQILKNGSPTLLLSLRLALQGIETEKCSAGVIGPILNAATQGITNLVLSTYLEKENVGSKQFFTWLTQALILATISVFWKIAQFNLFTKEADKVEEERRQSLSFEWVLILILKTEIVQTIIKAIAKTCGANVVQQESIVKLMMALVLILALLTAAQGHKPTLKMLVLDLKEYLNEALEDLQTFINKAIEAQKTGDKASAISICIQQALASLADEDFETLYKAYQGGLEVIQATPEQMNNDINQVKFFADTIFNAFIQGSTELNRKTTAALMI